MFDWDAIIIGGGPAGLTAGLYLSRANYRTLLLEKNEFGGPIINYENIENYPGFSKGITGASLGSGMITQATNYGLVLKKTEVTEIELYDNGRYVKCTQDEGFMTTVVIIATGTHQRKMGIPGEDKLYGKGIISCALCDGGQFIDRTLAVCGGGDAGVTEALYMAKIASKVILIESLPELTASWVLADRALSNTKIQIRCDCKVKSILGETKVEGIEIINGQTGKIENIAADGVLIHIGQEPNNTFLKNTVPLDENGYILVNEIMETKIPFILAAGDIRSESPRQIVTATGDGAMAAISAQRLLQELK